jgi:hypothetical protein
MRDQPTVMKFIIIHSLFNKYTTLLLLLNTRGRHVMCDYQYLSGILDHRLMFISVLLNTRLPLLRLLARGPTSRVFLTNWAATSPTGATGKTVCKLSRVFIMSSLLSQFCMLTVSRLAISPALGLACIGWVADTLIRLINAFAAFCPIALDINFD